MVPALLVSRLRAVAVLLLTQVAFMFRDGYMPYSYVAAMLPFAALCMAGLLDSVCPSRTSETSSWAPENPSKALRDPSETSKNPEQTKGRSSPSRGLRLAAVAVVGAAALVALPWRWGPALHEALTVDAGRPNREAIHWFLKNVPPGHVTITDDYAWLDLVHAGFTPEPIWHWKVDEHRSQAELENGWRDVDYVLVGHPWMVAPPTRAAIPVLDEALRHSVVVKSFGGEGGGEGDGEVSVRRVVR
jgi:hypothetical protein